jgi:hypothetical protein
VEVTGIPWKGSLELGSESNRLPMCRISSFWCLRTAAIRSASTDAFTNDLLMRLCQPGPLTPKNQRTSGARRQDIEFVFAVNFGLAFHSCARTARRRRLSHFYSQSSTWWRSLVDYILLLRAELGWHSVRRLRGGVVEQRGKQAEAVHRQDYLKCMYNMHILSDEP